MNTLGKRLHPQRLRRTLGAASCVRERARFVANELRDASIVREYHVRESGLLAAVRHPLLDMWVLEEMFRFQAYKPPASVRRSLEALDRPLRIVDLGGHVGLFGLFMRGLFPDASIVSFEPDPNNVAVLRRNIEVNALAARWRVLESCAATSDGQVEFESNFHLSRIAPASDQSLKEIHGHIGEAFGFLEGTALMQPAHRQVACADVFPFLAEADLVKIDVEGAEWEILADPRFAGLEATAFVLEYHPTYTSEPDAERAARRTLERAGYETEAPIKEPDNGLIWAWRPPARAR
jgi:FkbM family methyltransferase